MLHIDRNTKAYLDALDANIKSTPLASKGIETEINKIFSDIEEDWEHHYRRVQKGMQSFNNKLHKALSDPIPSRYIGKARPILRQFPFKMPDSYGKGGRKEGGGLVNSLYYSVGRHKDPSNNKWNIIVEYGATHEHADWTNTGRGSSRAVHWLHWADRVFSTDVTHNVRHSKRVPDIRDILLGHYG
jgi:hypothetical protein